MRLAEAAFSATINVYSGANLSVYQYTAPVTNQYASQSVNPVASQSVRQNAIQNANLSQVNQGEEGYYTPPNQATAQADQAPTQEAEHGVARGMVARMDVEEPFYPNTGPETGLDGIAELKLALTARNLKL